MVGSAQIRRPHGFTLIERLVVSAIIDWLAYAQNGMINLGETNMSSAHIQDPEGTIFFADTDGWDAPLYSDDADRGNVGYRHSGGNERSAKMEHGITGVKGAKRRANAVFVASHVNLIKAAPNRMFTVARD